jgi:hypothetical protein
MPATYEKIATTTLGSATTTITFSTIAATYTDIKCVWVGTTASAADITLTFNSDTGSNYSQTYIDGTGTSAISGRLTSQTKIYLYPNGGTSTTIPSYYGFDVFSYAGSTYKTLLTEGNGDKNGSGDIARQVALWRSTSAITTITLTSTSNMSIGTTATLYGILKA